MNKTLIDGKTLFEARYNQVLAKYPKLDNNTGFIYTPIYLPPASYSSSIKNSGVFYKVEIYHLETGVIHDSFIACFNLKTMQKNGFVNDELNLANIETTGFNDGNFNQPYQQMAQFIYGEAVGSNIIPLLIRRSTSRKSYIFPVESSTHYGFFNFMEIKEDFTQITPLVEDIYLGTKAQIIDLSTANNQIEILLSTGVYLRLDMSGGSHWAPAVKTKANKKPAISQSETIDVAAIVPFNLHIDEVLYDDTAAYFICDEYSANSSIWKWSSLTVTKLFDMDLTELNMMVFDGKLYAYQTYNKTFYQVNPLVSSTNYLETMYEGIDLITYIPSGDYSYSGFCRYNEQTETVYIKGRTQEWTVLLDAPIILLDQGFSVKVNPNNSEQHILQYFKLGHQLTLETIGTFPKIASLQAASSRRVYLHLEDSQNIIQVAFDGANWNNQTIDIQATEYIGNPSLPMVYAMTEQGILQIDLNNDSYTEKALYNQLSKKIFLNLYRLDSNNSIWICHGENNWSLAFAGTSNPVANLAPPKLSFNKFGIVGGKIYALEQNQNRLFIWDVDLNNWVYAASFAVRDMATDGDQLYIINDETKGVMRQNDDQSDWVKFGSSGDIITAREGYIAVNTTSNNIWQYKVSEGKWVKIVQGSKNEKITSLVYSENQVLYANAQVNNSNNYKIKRIITSNKTIENIGSFNQVKNIDAGFQGCTIQFKSLNFKNYLGGNWTDLKVFGESKKIFGRSYANGSYNMCYIVNNQGVWKLEGLFADDLSKTVISNRSDIRHVIVTGIEDNDNDNDTVYMIDNDNKIWQYNGTPNDWTLLT
jgi:hypothetical protein